MTRDHNYYVYIVVSPSRTLYIGATNNLEQRVWQHRHKKVGGFMARYNVSRLVWFEWHTMVKNAIAREKQIKDWLRAKKVALVEAESPKWWDLSRDWEI